MVLVHGFVVSSRYLLPLARVLARERDVWLPDLPGFGRSPGPRAALPMPGLADALAAWLLDARLAPATLLANSMGCQVLAELGARHPRVVDRLVLVGPTVDPAARGPLREALRWLLESPRDLPLTPIVAADLVRARPRRALATYRHMLAHRMEDVLPRVAAPTLVVRGEHDRIASAAWVERAAALLPHGRALTVPGVGHAANFHGPEPLARAVQPFLDTGGASLAPPGVADG